VGLLMIAGEFDLSIGSVLAFCSLIGTLHGFITVKGIWFPIVAVVLWAAPPYGGPTWCSAS